jgi:Tfp pilus assembly protein PilF/GR25 family glycosyltransferase involved in LPS biosynthesis
MLGSDALCFYTMSTMKYKASSIIFYLLFMCLIGKSFGAMEIKNNKFNFENPLQDKHVIDLQAYQLSHIDTSRLYKWLLEEAEATVVGRIHWHPQQNRSDSFFLKIEQLLKERRTTYQNRASPYVYAILSQQAYKNNGGSEFLPEGWEVYKTSGAGSNPDGYFGVAYRNKRLRHIIVAYRGTKADRLRSLLKDTRQDIMGVMQKHVTPYEASAYAFSEDMIRDALGSDYQISFAGHSLGGWLAQVSVYQATKQKYYTFAIVFDSPGVFEKLESHESRLPSAEQIALNKLDITVYLSVPNLINTCRTHLGTVYRLYPPLPMFVFYKPFGYLLETHSIDRQVKCFDAGTGLPIKYAHVIDWPRIDWAVINPNSTLLKACVGALIDFTSGKKVEYDGFLSLAKKENEYDPIQDKNLSRNDKYFLDNAYHYRIKTNADLLEIDCRHLSEDVFNFLMKYQNNKDKIGSLSELPSVKKLDIPQELSPLLNYQIEPYLNKQGYILKLNGAKSFKDLITFQNRVTALIRYYKELKYIDYDNYFRYLLNQAKGWQLSQIRRDIQQQKRSNIMLLLKLASLQAQPRLYLYGESTDDERAEVNEQTILIMSRLDANNELLKELDQRFNNVDEYVKQEIYNFKEGLDTQRLQLQLALKMNRALQHQRLRHFLEAKNCIDGVLEDLEGLSDNQKKQLFNENYSENKLKATLYNMQAKVYRVLLPKAEWGKIEQSYNFAIENDPQNATLYSSKAAFCNDWGRHIDAINLHRRAEQLDNYKAIVLSNLGWGIYQLSKEKGTLLEHAAEVALYYEKSLKMANYLAGTWYYQGLLKRDQGNIQGAFEDFNKALDIQPGHPKILYYRAQLFFDLKNYNKSLADTERAKLSLDPKIPDHSELLEILSKLEENVRASLAH